MIEYVLLFKVACPFCQNQSVLPKGKWTQNRNLNRALVQ
jgi:hypothetical protein